MSDASAGAPSRAQLEGAITAFVSWLRRAGYTSYDQYDFWATRYGIWSKGLVYRHGMVASPLVLPLVGADLFWPSSRRWWCPRRRFAIADAHYLMGFAALHRATGEPHHRAAAVELGDSLRASSLAGFSGPCWGYPFDWQTRRGLWRQGTPLVTSTPYVFDAFLDLYDLTRQPRDRETALGVAAFVARDIRDTPVGNGAAASYTPFDDSQVINASAYRAACLARAAGLTGAADYRRAALGNMRFVLAQQRADGAWRYSANDPSDAFVDHIHTCFVLKGLYRAYLELREAEILAAVRRGFDYYRRHLFHPDGQPRPFAELARPQLVAHELYDYAEALNLALLLRGDVTTDALADAMAARLVGDCQTPDGFFITRRWRGGLCHRVPYHRWAQAQAFCALARYYEQRTAT